MPVWKSCLQFTQKWIESYLEAASMSQLSNCKSNTADTHKPTTSRLQHATEGFPARSITENQTGPLRGEASSGTNWTWIPHCWDGRSVLGKVSGHENWEGKKNYEGRAFSLSTTRNTETSLKGHHSDSTLNIQILHFSRAAASHLHNIQNQAFLSQNDKPPDAFVTLLCCKTKNIIEIVPLTSEALKASGCEYLALKQHNVELWHFFHLQPSQFASAAPLWKTHSPPVCDNASVVIWNWCFEQAKFAEALQAAPNISMPS